MTQNTQTSAAAISSLVLGILGLICFSAFAGIPAVICGHVSLSKIKKSEGTLGGGGLAIAGLVTGYISIAMLPLMAAIAIPSFMKSRETSMKNVCINNMRVIEIAKEQASIELNVELGSTLTDQQLSTYLDAAGMTCPAGGTYSNNAIGEEPSCTVHGTKTEASTYTPSYDGGY